MEDIPDDENGAVLRRMRSQGDSLQAARNIDYSVIFPDEGSAFLFSRLIASEGFAVTCSRSDTSDDYPWDVTVTKHMRPSHREIGEVETYLDKLASPLNGCSDGWGCFTVEDMQPE